MARLRSSSSPNTGPHVDSSTTGVLWSVLLVDSSLELELELPGRRGGVLSGGSGGLDRDDQWEKLAFSRQ